MKFSGLFHNRPRLFVGLFLGMAAGWILPMEISARLRSILGWDMAAAIYILLVLATIGRGSALDSLKKSAAREDQSRWIILIMMCAAAFISLIAIGTLLSGMKDLSPRLADVHLALAALTVLSSWSLMHMLFAVHYAHEYYGDTDATEGSYSARGGLQFPGTDEPAFTDFLYYSYVVGMTCQVSDVQVSQNAMRRLTMAHGILSFFFNTIILALSVNIAAGLVT